MHSRSFVRFVTLAFVAVLGGAGCGKTVGIKGKVTLDGQPVEGASVQFVPIGEGQPAFGTTDASGVFTLSTFKQGDGALKGEYKVTVSKMSDNVLPFDPQDKNATKAAMFEIMKKSTGTVRLAAQKKSLPGIYSDHNTTPLLQTIPDTNGYNLELFSKLGAEGKLRK
jgi:hypothetical protein